MTEDEFRSMCDEGGWESPQDKHYAPNDVPDMHSHDFDAAVRITEGELLMTYPDRVDVLGMGDHCVVPAGTIHSEQTGPAGAKGDLTTRKARSFSPQAG